MAQRIAPSRVLDDGLLPSRFLILFLSTEIQASRRPPSVDPLIADDEADPGARDRWIGQIDVFPDQPRPVTTGIDQPAARSIVPVEQQVEAVADGFRFGLALFPFGRVIVRDRG